MAGSAKTLLRQHEGKGGGAGEIRLIGGLWKRTKLKVPDQPGLRPTPDRVRETLFNWLGHDLTAWKCFDTFAGTGALGFEAASRGAAGVTLVEQDAGLVAQLKSLKTQLNAEAVQVLRGDGISLLKAQRDLDLVFLDPPFDANLFEPALMAAASAVKSTGFVYLETPKPWADVDLLPYRLRVHRHLKAGAVYAHLLVAVSGI